MRKAFHSFTSAILILIFIFFTQASAQETQESNKLTPDKLTIDDILSGKYRQEAAPRIEWINGGEYYLTLEPSQTIEGAYDNVKYKTDINSKEIFVTAEQLIPKDWKEPLGIASYSLSPDRTKLLIFTNTKRVWRTNTRGDYWVLDLKTKQLTQLGPGKSISEKRFNDERMQFYGGREKLIPESNLMFAKFSPNGQKVAYVFKSNIYVEDLNSKKVTQLTTDGDSNIINGTFDWAYEEEFGCKDGFMWSPDGMSIAFWQINATYIKDFLLINNTDDQYSKTIPIQYPKAGEDPSSAKIGVVSPKGGKITWMKIPGDPVQNYIPKMQWVSNKNKIYVDGVTTKNPLDEDKLIVQQLNRKQNEINFWLCNPLNGKSELIYSEKDEAFIEPESIELFQDIHGENVFFTSEKGGWRHIYMLSLKDQSEMNLTTVDYDVIDIKGINTESGDIFFTASPENATQRYLYKVNYKTPGEPEKVTPYGYEGTNVYNISPDGKYAVHTFSNANTPRSIDLITLAYHNIIAPLSENKKYKEQIANLDLPQYHFFKLTTENGIEMDAQILFPPDFDSTKKYPVFLSVYGEPGGQTALDRWDFDWNYVLAEMGYIILTMDNRGTPAPKGREWRKSIYKNNGSINSHDIAMGMKEISKWNFIDPERIAVYGWSGGGTTTLNLLFRYPEIFKTGISVAPVTDLHLYDNIYTERYMGLPQENEEAYKENSAVTNAKNLQGNLLLIHGTGDDNVHYQNTEALINELVRNNKQFQVMPYPNRSHGIFEGQNTRKHLYNLMLNFLTKNTPPGGKITSIN
ncbi:MAG TPA: DPP IV N-terminal domain-containing protein [Ignavibacteria bacterium]|nr:DPP IV N-terminal domain-containing protein [Ignavibacteria bacterium]